MSGIAEVHSVFLLLLFFVLFFGMLARKLNMAYPIVMVIGGLILSFVPVMPGISLNPDLIFLVVLPPLLYASAWTTSWRDFRRNLASILLLAFGLVGFTVLGVALAAPKVFPGFDWRLGLVLGAVVAPTDAIAATSLARRIGLPSRIVDILEGESLINDASGLLALEFAIGILVERHMPAVSTGLLRLVWLVAGGIGLGLLIGWVADWIERRIDDASIEITLSILVPYAAYLAAETAHASGVLAVVACGLFLARRSATFFSPSVRIKIWSVWEALTFVLNGLIFVLIGLQLPAIRADLQGRHFPTLLLYGAIFSALLVALRLLWVFPGAHLAYLIRRRLLHQSEPPPTPRQVFIVGWTGMRGVVSLAAALALPYTLADGSPFPQRDVIVFLVFCVIVVTLAIQGLTLPAIIRLLKLGAPAGPNCEEQDARRIVATAALDHIETAQTTTEPVSSEVYEHLADHYRKRLESLNRNDEDASGNTDHRRYVELTLESLRVERETVIRLRDEGRINDEVLRRLERELDYDEARLITSDV